MRGQWAGGIRRDGSSPLWVLTFESGLESNMLFTSASLAFGERVPNPSTAICSRPRGLIGVAGVIRGSGRSDGWVGFITVSVGRPIPAGGLGCSVVVTAAAVVAVANVVAVAVAVRVLPEEAGSV